MTKADPQDLMHFATCFDVIHNTSEQQSHSLFISCYYTLLLLLHSPISTPRKSKKKQKGLKTFHLFTTGLDKT